jgi:hypothetical protein
MNSRAAGVRRQQAVTWQTKAIKLVNDENDNRLAKDRLQLYESGKPFRLLPKDSTR